MSHEIRTPLNGIIGMTDLLAETGLDADVLPENQVHCREAGMDDFLAKPVRKEHLREVLGRWLPG